VPPGSPCDIGAPYSATLASVTRVSFASRCARERSGSSGRERIYDGYPDVALDMINSRTFDGRSQLVEYVPKVLAGPPSADKTKT